MKSPLFILRDIDYNGNLEKELRSWVRSGITIREAADWLDVSKSTAHRWMSQATGNK